MATLKSIKLNGKKRSRIQNVMNKFFGARYKIF